MAQAILELRSREALINQFNTNLKGKQHSSTLDSAGKDDDAFQMTLDGQENIFSLPALFPETIYY